MLTLDASATEVDSTTFIQRSEGSPTIKDSTITSSNLAYELGVTPSKICEYKRLVIRIRHPLFREYKSRTPLTKSQADLIRQCRIWLLDQERGDSLKRKLLSYPNSSASPVEQMIEEVGNYCVKHSLVDSSCMPEFLSFVRTVFNKFYNSNA